MMPDFEMLHAQLAELCRFAMDARAERRPRPTAADSLSRGIGWTVTDPSSGADYAAMRVGSTIAALAGIKAMHDAFDYIEVNVGEQEAVWLSRRWAGIVDPSGACWG